MKELTANKREFAFIRGSALFSPPGEILWNYQARGLRFGGWD
jgi:hypothetical protein